MHQPQDDEAGGEEGDAQLLRIMETMQALLRKGPTFHRPPFGTLRHQPTTFAQQPAQGAQHGLICIVEIEHVEREVLAEVKKTDRDLEKLVDIMLRGGNVAEGVTGKLA
ncbi:hypothetical protein DM450_22120 [Sphingomonas sp. IC081]|nr:hypothetical protein DM450_22120 [Sphingomonas sp. IC081]QSR20298.1 hypothetical protein CA833_24510 [Novosphingobium sp. KA1]